MCVCVLTERERVHMRSFLQTHMGVRSCNGIQVCVAIKRVFVHESIKEQLVDCLVAEAEAAIVGDGMSDPQTKTTRQMPRSQKQYPTVRGDIN